MLVQFRKRAACLKPVLCPGMKTQTVNPDFKELLLAFNAHNVEYLIVGAHALAAHGHVRATKDLDLWVRPDDQNA